MRLPELCLALLCAAVAGTDSPGAAREQPPGAAAAAGRAAEAGRGGPGAAAPRAGGVDPRQAWMLLAGSPGQVGVPGAVPGPPSVPEELRRELQLLLKGMVKEQVKTRRKAWEGREEEEESEGNPQAGSHRRVEAAFRCQTCENISIEQRARLELQLYYIPEREGMFHRGPGLNLTSGQYTAPITGYYTHLHRHTAHSAQGAARKRQTSWGNRLRVLICVQSCCQHNGNLETVSGPGWRVVVTMSPSLPLESFTYRLDSTPVFVDNTAGSPLTIQSGSDFSAILLGV